MSGKVDWKQKYMELRSKYLNAIDVSFKLGVQEGAKNAEMENLQMQAQQAEEQAALAAQGGVMPPGEEMPPGAGEELPPEEMPPGEEQGGEPDLDSSINELESFVKGESKLDIVTIMKNIHKSTPKAETATPKSKKAEKVEGFLKKWDEEAKTAEDTNDDGILGQS